MKAITLVFLVLELSVAFQPSPPKSRQLRASFNRLSSSTETVNEKEEAATTKPCFWQPPGKFWEQRRLLETLEIGQELTGIVVQELLDGKTGGKMFLDCGVGRIDANGNWQIVNGMHRIRDRKKTVIKKRAAKIRQKESVQLWVSRILAPNFQFEVVVREQDIPEPSKPKIPASSLKVGQEVVGEVVRVESYGVLVDVGANRNGLLHIQRVADLYGRYIHKEEGLIEAGLERGAKIRVAVSKNEKKRLSLDFTEDVKADVQEEQSEETEQDSESKSTEETSENESEGEGGMSDEEAAAWAEFAAADAQPSASISNTEPAMSDEEAAAWAAYGSSEDDDDDDDDDEDYDDDRDIEDALGIGMY